jgi:hypothetical protein
MVVLLPLSPSQSSEPIIAKAALVHFPLKLQHTIVHELLRAIRTVLVRAIRYHRQRAMLLLLQLDMDSQQVCNLSLYVIY